MATGLRRWRQSSLAPSPSEVVASMCAQRACNWSEPGMHCNSSSRVIGQACRDEVCWGIRSSSCPGITSSCQVYVSA